jgi:hypothetical protein
MPAASTTKIVMWRLERSGRVPGAGASRAVPALVSALAMVLVLASLAVAESIRQDGALESTASQGLG